MGNVNAELFVARRTSRAGDGGRAAVMERIAVVSVALSMAVTIVAMAVIAGFKSQVSERLSGLGAHVTVMAAGGNHAAPQPVVRNSGTERAILAAGGVDTLRAFVSKGGVIRSDRSMQGVLLKGVEGGYGGTFFEQTLAEGRLPRTDGEERTKDILISRTTASLLDVGVGDRVEMIFLDDDHGARRDRFAVTGIYSTGMEEAEALVLTDMRNVQRLCGWTTAEVAGYEVALDDMSDAAGAARQIGEMLFDEGLFDLRARSIVDLNPGIFDWLRTHDVNAAVVTAVMLIVAVFNMLTALLIIVFERTRMIGILKTLGMSDGALQRLFLYRSAAIVVRGLVWGNVVGLALCWVQALWHPVKLDSAGYLLSEVPVDIVPWHVAALNAGAVAVIVAAMALPARITARIRPAESLRYE